MIKTFRAQNYRDTAYMVSETGATAPKTTTQGSNPIKHWAPVANGGACGAAIQFNNMSETLATLYKRNSNGKLQQWRIYTKGNSYFVEEGVVGGKLTTSAAHMRKAPTAQGQSYSCRYPVLPVFLWGGSFYNWKH